VEIPPLERLPGVSEVNEPTQSGKASGYNYDVLTYDLKQSVQRSQIMSPLTLAVEVLLVVVTTLVLLSFKVVRWNR